MRVVLDNSVTVGWIHPDQATGYSTALLDGRLRYEALAPAVWVLEFSNTLLVLLRRKRLSDLQRQSALARAGSWKIALDTTVPHLVALSNLASEHGLTTYDAAYLDCALRNDARVATQDAALRKAAHKLDCWFDTNTL